MHFIKLKLRSQSGASITFALLLFLVCAVLSSVIIVASTASAGRMSGIAEMDQRYYSVSSASELLKDLLNEKMVAIVTVTTTTTKTPIEDDIQQTPYIDDVDWVVYIVPNKTDAELAAMSADEFRSACVSPTSGVQKIDAKGFTGPVYITSLLNDAAYQYYRIKKSTSPSVSSRDLSLRTDIPKPAGVDVDPLAVTIEEIMDTSGNISLTLFNTNGNPYSRELQFTLMPSVKKPGKETPPIKSPSDPSLLPDPSNYTQVEKETRIQFLPLKWKLL